MALKQGAMVKIKNDDGVDRIGIVSVQPRSRSDNTLIREFGHLTSPILVSNKKLEKVNPHQTKAYDDLVLENFEFLQNKGFFHKLH